MATAEITAFIEYPEAFDFEDLRTIIHRVLSEAQAQGALDLPAAENGGVKVECSRVGRICPNWRD